MIPAKSRVCIKIMMTQLDTGMLKIILTNI